MNERPDFIDAGRQLLEWQLTLMHETLALMASGTQRLLALGLATAASTTRDSLQAARELPRERPQSLVAMATELASANMKRAASYGNELSDLRFTQNARLANAGREYALRIQEDVDSILHAFAMAPVAADRLIRTSALGREGPARATVQPPAPARPARRQAARQARQAGQEHAR